MVTELIASKQFNWKPDIIESNEKSPFIPGYVVSTEPGITADFKSKFADLPSCGMWADRKEGDDELLDKLAGNWSGFGSDQ